MKYLSLFVMLIVAPCTVFADCILIDTPYKFEGVCWGYNPMSPPTTSKRNASKKSGKAKKVRFYEREKATLSVGMNEEELQYMQARNKMDGYRGELKPMDKTAKN